MNEQKILDRIERLNESLFPELEIRGIIPLGKKYAPMLVHHMTDTSIHSFMGKSLPTRAEVLRNLIYLEEIKMLSIFELMGQKFEYLVAEMFPKNKVTFLTVESVKVEMIEGKEGKVKKPVIYFKETKRGFVLGNQTNPRSLAETLGIDVEQWKGKRVGFTRTQVKAFGEEHRVLRIDEKATVAENKKMERANKVDASRKKKQTVVSEPPAVDDFPEFDDLVSATQQPLIDTPPQQAPNALVPG